MYLLELKSCTFASVLLSPLGSANVWIWICFHFVLRGRGVDHISRCTPMHCVSGIYACLEHACIPRMFAAGGGCRLWLQGVGYTQYVCDIKWMIHMNMWMTNVNQWSSINVNDQSASRVINECEFRWRCPSWCMCGLLVEACLDEEWPASLRHAFLGLKEGDARKELSKEQPFESCVCRFKRCHKNWEGTPTNRGVGNQQLANVSNCISKETIRNNLQQRKGINY